MRKSPLKGGNISERRKSVLAFQKSSFIKSFKKLRSILENDASPVVRHEAAFVLGTFKNEAVIPYLLRTIGNDPSDLVRHEAIEALADIGIKTEAIKFLLKRLLKDKNPFIKDTARMTLQSLEK